MPTLSLAMIVKNEGDTIERVLGSAKPFCDEMVVVDTGSNDDTAAKAQAMGAVVHHFPWIDDFAAARNFSFSQCSKDWIIWLDGDDVVTPDNQQRLVNLKHQVLDDELEAVFLRYVCPPYSQSRERIIRRALFGTKLNWRSPIHECIDGIDLRKSKYRADIAIQHDPPLDRFAPKKDRNITILRRHYQNGAHDERTLFMYAMECLNVLRQTEAEDILPAFFAVARNSTYKYELYHRMYDFYMDLAEPARALEALGKAIVEDPKCAEGYYKLGKHLLNKKDDPRGAIPLLQTASAIAMPDYGIPETAAYTYGPWDALCRAYFRLEDYAKAKDMARQALRHHPPQRHWLAKLVDYETQSCPSEPLPPPWQKWLEINLFQKGAPRPNLIHILEDNQFTPGQIVTALRRARPEVAGGPASEPIASIQLKETPV
jgi:glycosyltransferase involved in cell wall biosynthesis